VLVGAILSFSFVVAMAACLNDAPTSLATGPVKLNISAQVLGGGGGPLPNWTVEIRVYYWTNGESQIDLPLDPSVVELGRGQQVEQAVEVDITPCLSDPDRMNNEGDDQGCRLFVELTLFDEDGVPLSVETEDALATTPGETLEELEFVLPPGAIVVTSTLLQFTAAATTGIPAPSEVGITSSTPEPLGALTAAVTYLSGTNWLTTDINQGDGAVVIVEPSTTDLAPGTYEATLTITSSRDFVPAELLVRYVVTPRPKRLTITGAGNGSGDITLNELDANCTIVAGNATGTCSPLAPHGSQLTLSAGPIQGSTFAGWSGACTGTGPCVLNMDQDRAVTATFTLVPKQLTVTMAGDGNGTVSSSPQQTISCTKTGTVITGPCTSSFVHGTQVTLTTFAPTGFAFSGWSGACTGMTACVLAMTQDRAVTATFSRTTQRLTITGIGTGTGLVFTTDELIDCAITGGQTSGDCVQDYPVGAQVAVQREATGGGSFGGWSGACSGTGACVVMMDKPQTVTARFNGAPPPGRDIVVFNDVNVFDATATSQNPNNFQLIRNLINFTATGPRNAGRSIQLDCGRGGANSFCSFLAPVRTIAAEFGLTVFETSSQIGTLTSFNPDVKTLFLVGSCAPFNVPEVNAMKQFAADGGRIIFIGENLSAFPVNCVAVQAQLLKDMGAQMTNVGDVINPGYTLLPATSLRQHQIMTGLTSLTIAASSQLILGPNDFALYFDTSNTLVLSGVARIDVTPLPLPSGIAAAASGGPIPRLDSSVQATTGVAVPPR
jgi:hypothetical protein